MSEMEQEYGIQEGLSQPESIGDLKEFAGEACIDFYLSLHVSQMRDQSEQSKKVWSAGQELYLATRR